MSIFTKRDTDLLTRMLIILACEKTSLTAVQIYYFYDSVWNDASYSTILWALRVLTNKRIIDFDHIDLTYKFLK